MAKSKTKEMLDVININITPVKGNIGVYRYENNDFKTIAFVVPRNKVYDIKFNASGLRYNSIYFLFGYEKGVEKVYVGQATEGKDNKAAIRRLIQHDKVPDEVYYPYWDTAVIVTNEINKWNVADLYALEHAFCQIIPKKNLWNKDNPNSGGADYDYYITKIQDIKRLVTAVGYNVFKSEDTDKQIHLREDEEIDQEELEEKIVEDLHDGLARVPEIVTPQKTVNEICNMIPEDLWNEETVFLDLACKGGEFLKEIYNRLMNTESLKIKYEHEIERSNHILGEQIFGVALSNVSYNRTVKALLGYSNNIKIIPKFLQLLKGKEVETKSDGSIKTIKNILDERFNREMRVNVVIGNPPYQEVNGGGGRAIYNLFVEQATKMSDKVLMITSNTWLTSDILTDFRKNVFSFGVRSITNYPRLGDIFKGMSVSVAILNMDKDCDKNTEYKSIVNNEIVAQYTKNMTELAIVPDSSLVLDIMDKTKSKKIFNEKMDAKLPFGMESNGRIGASGNADYIDISDTKTDDLNIPILYMYGQDPVLRYTNNSSIIKNKKLIHKYKLVCGRVLHENTSVITNLRVLDNNSACTGSYSLIYYSDNLEDVNIAYKYVKTKFVRFLVYIMVNSYCRVTPYRFQLIPLQDFTSNSDIDWNLSVSEIDKQLYKKYNLTQEEINYIEKTIKPME